METLNTYRKIIRDLLQQYAAYQPARGDIEVETIFDEMNDHYELMYTYPFRG